MLPERLELLRSVSEPAVHPDGEVAVVSVTRPDFDADAYVGQLWLVRATGEAPRRLTRGFRDAAPKFSPDGRCVAFLRSAPEQKPQIYLIPLDGGEAVCVTDAKLGVTEFDFAADGSHIYYCAPVAAEGRCGSIDGVAPAAEDPRHITTYQFQMNGVGYYADAPAQVFQVAVPDVYGEPPIKKTGRAAVDAEPTPMVPEPTQISDSGLRHSALVCGSGEVYVTVSGDPKLDETLYSEIHAYDPASGEWRVAAEAAGPALMAVCPVGDRLFALGADLGETGRDFVGANTGVYIEQAGGWRRLTDAESIDVSGSLRPYGDQVVTTIRHRGSAGVAAISAEGDLSELVTGNRVCSFAVGAADGVWFVFSSPTTAGELARVIDGEMTVLTDFSADLRAETTIIEPQELIAESRDGYPVHGWVLKPETKGPHPVLLNIHGGPYADYTGSYFDEAQTYVNAGYAVVMCNPRGAAGYGASHGRAIQGDFGNLDMADILAFLDHALATNPDLDSQRMGVMGGSYGGYMTAWIIAHDHRFAGAIVERGFLDPKAFIGASDIGWFFATAYTTSDPERMDAQSPTLLANQVQTPTLVVHSEADLRCPLSQGLRYYAELKLNGVKTELLVFPGENHELSRSGTPWHRRQRLEAILNWWHTHLPVASETK